MSVGELPEDCLKHILGFLNLSCQLRASVACKYFQKIVKDPSFRVDLNLSVLLSYGSRVMNALNMINKSFKSRTRRVVMPTLPLYDNPLTYAELGLFPSVETIDFYGMTSAKLALEVLQHVCPLSVKQFIGLPMHSPNERSLWENMAAANAERQKTLANEVTKVLPQFTILSDISVTVPSIYFAQSVVENVPKLTRFDATILEGGSISSLMTTLSDMENLEWLRLDVRGKTDDNLEFTSQSCKALSVHVTTLHSSIIRCPQLEHLRVIYGQYLVLETPKIETIVITEWIDLMTSIDGAPDSWNFPPSLRYLSMTNCKSIRQPHQVLPALARDCPALWYLSLQYCVLGEQLTIYPIAQLEVLDLSYHLEATGIVFDCRGSTSFDKLKKIDFSENLKLQTIAVVGDSTKAFPCVAELHLSDVWRGDMDSFAEFMKKLPGLKRVHADKLPDFMKQRSDAVNRGITVTGLRSNQDWERQRSANKK